MKSSLSSSTNYRSISLLNPIGKVFDYAIILISNTCFQTSNMQFGFKQLHSTVMCSLLYHEVINHYLCNGSNVYSCLLDASKAFDKVHYGTMLSILLNKNVPYCIIRLLMDVYVRLEARVIWNSCHPTYFRFKKRGKTGMGALSNLFHFYIDILLVTLTNSGLGCHINGTYMGALSYADDITLSCPSVYGLNKNMNIYTDFATNNFITFNAQKNICIKYGDPVGLTEHVILDGKVIS